MRVVAVASVAALMVALALLAPLAQADQHVFSHRVHVVGRVVDADGRPAAGAPVTVAFRGFEPGGRCFDERNEPTGPQGDFRICRHAHALPDDAVAAITVGDTTVEAPVNRTTRHAWAHVQLDAPREARDLTGDRAFERTFRVAGRAVTPVAPGTQVESVPVSAAPLVGRNVSVRLGVGLDTLASGHGNADEMGVFEVDLDIEEVPADARVRVEVDEQQVAVDASTLFRRADVLFVRDARATSIPAPGGNGSIEPPPPPGSETPAPGAFAALVALGVTAAVVARRPPRR